MGAEVGAGVGVDVGEGVGVEVGTGVGVDVGTGVGEGVGACVAGAGVGLNAKNPIVTHTSGEVLSPILSFLRLEPAQFARVL